MRIRPALLLVTLFAATTAGAADLSLRFFPPVRGIALPGAQHHMLAIVENRTENTRANIHVRITFDPALAIEEVSHWPFLWECTSKPGQIDCTHPDFTIGADGQIRFIVRMPESPAGGDYEFQAVVTSTPADPNLSNNTATTTVHVTRQTIVSNTNDSGPGSLRAAIEEANGWCTSEQPCEIRFRFPDGAVPVIEPLSPLPPLTACGVKVGDPPFSFGDPVRMQVEISGRRLTSGNGLELRSACQFPAMELYGMTVNGFPGDGIVTFGQTPYHLHHLAVGTDPAGTRALPNGGRGIVHLSASGLTVTDSLVGGNVRSGIAVFNGSLRVSASRIGIGHDGRDLHNGASGIFIAPSAFDVDISSSVIANHPHFGVALAGQRLVTISEDTVIKENILDLDWFLDGPGPTVGRRTMFIPPTPRVLSATYDAAANVTRVTVAIDTRLGDHSQVRLYASDRITIHGTAHLEQFLGRRTPQTDPVMIDIAGDLRGKYVSAVTVGMTVPNFPDSPPARMISTSEVSAALKVD